MTHDEANLILGCCAFRYALGRKTYVVREVVDCLIKHRKKLDTVTKNLICKEIKYATEEGWAGMFMDVKDWKRVVEAFNE